MTCCLKLTAILAAFLIFVKYFLKWVIRWNNSATSLIGRTAIVTGANSGIGFYTARDFATRGAKVILACRNIDKAKEAQMKIIYDTNNHNVFIKIVDFSSLKSVRQFAKEINASEERLDILVNNAGVGDLENFISEDGLVELLQVNYFAPFLLTNLLIDLLKKSAPSRIVNVSSMAYYFSKLDINNLNSINRKRNYANSKLLNILFSCELARKLEGTGVVSNSLHPGIVKTEIFRTVPWYTQLILKIIYAIVFRSAEEGAQTSIYVSVSKNLETVSGKYFDNCGEAWLPRLPRQAADVGFLKKIWEKTEEIVNLIPDEKQF